MPVLSYLVLLSMVFWLMEGRSILGILNYRKEFRCRRCGVCCRLAVAVDDDEVAIIRAKGFNEFIEFRKGRKYLKRINNYCIFLTLKKGISECSIYDIRPRVCRQYPRTITYWFNAIDPRCRSFDKPRFFKYFN